MDEAEELDDDAYWELKELGLVDTVPLIPAAVPMPDTQKSPVHG